MSWDFLTGGSRLTVTGLCSPRGVFLEPFGRPLLRGGWLTKDACPAVLVASGCAASPVSFRLAGSTTVLFEAPFLRPLGRPLLRAGVLTAGESPAA